MSRAFGLKGCWPSTDVVVKNLRSPRLRERGHMSKPAQFSKRLMNVLKRLSIVTNPVNDNKK
jgi:hypothetical protein